MTRIRLSALARRDIASIFAANERRGGSRARLRGLIAAALRHVALVPLGATSAARDDLRPSLRSLHAREVRKESTELAIGHPVHVVWYRAGEAGLIEIVRVLNERREVGRGREGSDVTANQGPVR